MNFEKSQPFEDAITKRIEVARTDPESTDIEFSFPLAVHGGGGGGGGVMRTDHSGNHVVFFTVWGTSMANYGGKHCGSWLTLFHPS